jgi:hypothetical protein
MLFVGAAEAAGGHQASTYLSGESYGLRRAAGTEKKAARKCDEITAVVPSLTIIDALPSLGNKGIPLISTIGHLISRAEVVAAGWA